jgi:hypothetical protein
MGLLWLLIIGLVASGLAGCSSRAAVAHSRRALGVMFIAFISFALIADGLRLC